MRVFLFFRVIPLKIFVDSYYLLPSVSKCHSIFIARLLSLFTHWSILHAFVNECVHSENHQKGSIRTNFIKENVQKSQTVNSFDFVFSTIYIFTLPSTSLLHWFRQYSVFFSFALKFISSMWIDDVSMQTKWKKKLHSKSGHGFFSASKNVLNSTYSQSYT